MEWIQYLREKVICERVCAIVSVNKKRNFMFHCNIFLSFQSYVVNVLPHFDLGAFYCFPVSFHYINISNSTRPIMIQIKGILHLKFVFEKSMARLFFLIDVHLFVKICDFKYCIDIIMKHISSFYIR